MKYQPHDYQNYATQFIIDHPVAAILLQMGLGKSVITLTAIQKLLSSGEVYRVLVIAPLRVARDTWPAEIQKWDHLHGLTYSVAVGTESERRAALMLDANIHIINRENVQWLIENSRIPFEYDMIVIDELSSFKNHQAKRFKSLMKQRHRVSRVVGLTGTPSSNGLMDLFAEYKLLDMGKRLGRFITQYRQDFFVPDKCGYDRVYSWKPRPGAEQEIYRRIGDITVSMKSVDFLKIQTSSGDRKIPVVASHGTASWVDEEGAIPESDEVFGQITIGAHKVATMIKVSDELLQDSVFNIESYIAAEFARRIGAAEEDAFINGDGTGKPTGLLHATNGAGTGVTTAGNTIAADEIIDLVHSIKSVYRKKATFLMNDSTIKAIRKLKSIEGQYLWQPGLKEGQPDMLLNYRIVTSPYMPEVAAGNKVILFGDFKSYWIADRQGRSFQRLNELFAVTGQVGFRATQRVDGRLVLPEAMKCLAVKGA